MVGVIFCAASWVSGLFLAGLDLKNEKIEGKKAKTESDESEGIRLSDLKKFGVKYWLICVSCVLNYMALFPFQANALSYLQKRYNFTASEAGPIISITYLMAAGATPFIGIMTDKIGKRC